MRPIRPQVADPHEIRWGDLMEIGKPVAQPYDSTIVKTAAMQAALSGYVPNGTDVATGIDLLAYGASSHIAMGNAAIQIIASNTCLLYTSDAADDTR